MTANFITKRGVGINFRIPPAPRRFLRRKAGRKKQGGDSAVRRLPADCDTIGLMKRDFAAFVLSLGLAAMACQPWGMAAMGGAAAVWLLARARGGGRDRLGRAACGGALLIAAAFFSPWGAIAAASLLAGMAIAEALLAEGFFAGMARLLTAALCLVALLLQFVPAATGGEPFHPFEPAALMGALAALCEGAAVYRRSRRRATDPLFAAFLALALFAFAMTTAALAGTFSYPAAIGLAAGGFAAVLAAAALLLAPFAPERAAESLASQAFAMEAPIEAWLHKLSDIARDESDAGDFLDAAMRAFAELPGVRGAAWRVEGEAGEKQLGKVGPRAPAIAVPPLTVRAQARGFSSPWTWFNHYLLLRAAAEHYAAKEREERRRERHQVAAAHEAGARVAHDIKNILHALAALAEALERGGERGGDLARRQMPELRRRLQMALDKLRAPEADEPPSQTADAAEWWERARARLAHQPVEARTAGDAAGMQIPERLFDRALDNFAENALIKRASGARRIWAELRAGENGAELRVGDDGAAVAAKAAERLFVRPVESQTGFGVALRHLAAEAEKTGWRAELESNEDGKVVFALLPAQTDAAPEAELIGE